jgi:hypothetical protein
MPIRAVSESYRIVFFTVFCTCPIYPLLHFSDIDIEELTYILAFKGRCEK